MEYNTQRPHMKIPEYGRNIHKMVNYCLTVEDAELRSKVARSIVKVMEQIHAANSKQTNGDIKQKLWDHLFIMSDFELDVEAPYPKPSPETFEENPEKVPYPRKNFRYNQYGKTVELLIEKARTYSEGEEKDALTLTIANLMKRFYVKWNRDSVGNEVIVEHLKELSKGDLIVKDPSRLIATSEVMPSNSGGGGKKKKKRRSGGKGNRSRKRN